MLMLGIDIGTKFIKMCQVDMRGGVVYDVYTSMSEIPDSVKGDEREKIVAKTIKSMYKEDKFSAKNAAASLGSSEILIRKLDFPPIPKNELRNIIRLQAEKYIFSDLSKMDIDFHITSSQQDKMEVLLAAVPTEMVDRRMRTIQEAGLNIIVMDIDNLALANCFLTFNANPGEQEVIIMNIGHTKTNFTILSNGKFCFAKSVNFGGENIAEAIEKELEIQSEKATEIKEKYEMWNEIGLNIKNVLRKTTPDLLEAVYKAIEYCKSQKVVQNIDRILLTGGTSFLPGIDEFFNEILGIKTEIWNPISNIELIKKKEMGQYMSIALGLAVRKLPRV